MQQVTLGELALESSSSLVDHVARDGDGDGQQ
jgi:hypothetical protein